MLEKKFKWDNKRGLAEVKDASYKDDVINFVGVNQLLKTKHFFFICYSRIT